MKLDPKGLSEIENLIILMAKDCDFSINEIIEILKKDLKRFTDKNAIQ